MISQSQIVYLDGTVKKVKNLGWLLRHWKGIKEFRVYTKNLTNSSNEAYLVAELFTGIFYETGFASKAVTIDFLKRPTFYDLPVIIDGIQTTVTKDLEGGYLK
jgi:hypothetical protein